MQLNDLEFWIDVNMPPSLADWLTKEFGVKAHSFKELNLLTASDHNVFKLASLSENCIIITTKDIDFIQLSRSDFKPRILLISTGNISNKDLRMVFKKAFPQVIAGFTSGNQQIIEIIK